MARICVLLPYHWGAARGGAEFQAHLFAEHVTRNTNHEVIYLARFGPLDPDDFPYAIRNIGGPRLPGGLRWGYWPDAFALYRALEAIRPDCILHMVASAYTGVAAFYARRHRCHFCWYLASDRDTEWPPNVGITGPARFIDQMLFRYGSLNADSIIAQTNSQADRLKLNLSREADLVVGNFLPEVSPAPEKGRTVIATWIANVKQIKRPDLFLELANHFRDDSRIRFRMAGRMSEPIYATQIAKAANDLPNFEYLGELTLSQVESELAQAHLLINTSEYEGFPNVFIQAWQKNVPVYSLNVDPDGVLASEKIGHRTGSMQGMVDRLKAVLDDPHPLQAEAANARAFATARHSMRNADKVIDLLERRSKAGDPCPH